MSSTKGASEKTNSQSTTVTAVKEAPPTRMKDMMLLFKVLLLAFCLILLVVIITILAIQLVQAKKHKENLNLNYSALESEYSKLNLRYMEAYRKYSVLDQQCNGTNTGKPEDWTCAFCPETWLYFKGKCYYMSNETKTWNTSRDHCISLGGHLVIITSDAEKKFLQNTFNDTMNGPKQSYWIGLSDQEKEGNWYWIDNKSKRHNFLYYKLCCFKVDISALRFLITQKTKTVH
ncbi:CD209 antigen-like protein E isoform X2 [Erpetoichthys calabaricus]|uniref:CD209 antigen-like protein E n=1 Tax=Erpetoichthys calabaricus TaxID=27687 RepID=A0A8C4RMH1_ERPCA|nr:CD209 antigen-like protein E isoform X2 [Erpetoichthys calabaricus]